MPVLQILSKSAIKICETERKEEQETILNTVKKGYVVSWHHINFHGEYDFSPKGLRNAIEFNLQKIMELNLGV